MIPLLSQAAMRGPPAGAGGDDVREARDEVRDYIDCRVVGAHAAFLFLRGPPPRGLPPRAEEPGREPRARQPHAHLLPTGPRWAMWPKELRSFRLQVWGEERQFWAEYDEDDNYKGWLGARKEPPPQWHLALTRDLQAGLASKRDPAEDIGRSEPFRTGLCM